MADSNTVARPYAKAVFELALEMSSISEWSMVLSALAEIVADPLVVDFVRNPSTTPKEQSELLEFVLQKLCSFKSKSAVNNFLHLLAENKRLMALPSISAQFAQLRAEHEKTLMVEVRTFSSLTPAQEKEIIKRLTERLQRQITLNVHIDESLRGGLVISAGRLVIDASIATQIKKLSANLAA